MAECNVWEGVLGSNSFQCFSCNGWVRKHCAGLKSHLRTVCGIIRRRACVRGNYDNRIDIDFGMDLEDGKYQRRVGKLWYLGEVLNRNGDSTTALVSRTPCKWENFRELSIQSPNEKECVIEVERKNLCSINEKCHAVWERDLHFNCRAYVAIGTYRKKAKADKRKIIKGKYANRGVKKAHES